MAKPQKLPISATPYSFLLSPFLPFSFSPFLISRLLLQLFFLFSPLKSALICLRRRRKKPISNLSPKVYLRMSEAQSKASVSKSATDNALKTKAGTTSGRRFTFSTSLGVFNSQLLSSSFTSPLSTFIFHGTCRIQKELAEISLDPPANCRYGGAHFFHHLLF